MCHVLTGGLQFVVVRTRLDSVQGRKAKVSATMETLDKEIIAEAKSVGVISHLRVQADTVAGPLLVRCSSNLSGANS
jgi:hypothetical protein